MTVAVRRPGPRLPIPLYPIAIISLVVLHLWAASGISPFAAFRGLLVAFLIGVAVAVLSTVAMRGDRHRGGLLAVLLVLILVAGGRPGIVPFLLVPAALLLVERHGPWHPRLNWAWISRLVARGTAVFALAVLLEAVQLGRLGDLATVLQREGALRPGPPPPSASVAAPEAPDIYVIILDGYARSDVLADSYGLDESPFLDGLTERGFEIAPASHANYLVTNLSLSSMLNYRRVEDVPALAALAADQGVVNGPPVYRAVSGPAALADLREAGYETIAISSGFEQVALRTADRFIDSGQVNEFEIQLLRPSLLALIATSLVPDVLSGQHRDRTGATFEALGSLAGESDRPRFVFAHVASPHAPWVDNGDGSTRVTTNIETWYSDTPEAPGLSRDAVIAGYGGQVTHVGRQALDAVDQILAASDRPPVILVISDHGSSLDVTTENAEVRLRNLFAAYTPGRSGLYPADTTLVNVFPTLLDAYLGIDRPRAPEAIFSQGPGGLWDPVEIPR